MIVSGGGIKRKVLVLGLDGFPHSLLTERMEKQPRSIWRNLLEEGRLTRMNSSRPEVSSVAWGSYLTGANPGEHGLFGFVDRSFQPFRLFFPNGANLRKKTILERVHKAGGTVVSINMPATCPPKPLRGLIVGGFLAVRLEKNVHPVEWVERLHRHGYVLDIDPADAYRDKERFMTELGRILEARFNAAMEAALAFDWDLFQLHIMETDRLFHFFWEDAEFAEKFNALLDRVDEIVMQFAELARKKEAALVILSDHGFTRARRIFFINTWLKSTGYLAFDNNGAPSLQTISGESGAYALAPGRIFLNVRGREPMGRIRPGKEYESLQSRLAGELRQVRDSQDDLPVFSEVLPREEVYQGPYVNHAADLIAFPREGMDVKADFKAAELFATPATLVGTHTFDDAFFYLRGAENAASECVPHDIAEAGACVARLLGI